MSAQPFTKTQAMLDGEALVEYLQSRDVPCPGCGYNLRQLQSVDVSGQELKLSVGLVEQRLGPWIACLLGCALPGALGCIILVVLILNLDSIWQIDRIPWQALLMTLYPVSTIPAVIALLVRRRQFLRLTIGTQSLLAFASWVLIGAFILILWIS